jgi:light-regulated signal transduction histidine kinase (bacteriophytochrome)
VLIPIELRTVLTYDEQGRPSHMWAIIRDITARKRADAELREMMEELSRSNADLEQFASVASHDLQEPLRAVAGMVQLLQQRYQGQLDARADQYIDLAVEAATCRR